jgi:hypothetical protein
MAAIIGSVALCLAAPVARDVSRGQDLDDAYPDANDESLIYQHMISPNWQTLPEELFGPEYVWDTKGFPRRVGKPQARQEESHSSSMIHQTGNTDT